MTSPTPGGLVVAGWTAPTEFSSLTDDQIAQVAAAGEQPCGCGWHPAMNTANVDAWPWLWETHLREIRKTGCHGTTIRGE